MPVRTASAVSGAVLIGLLGLLALAGPAAADASLQPVAASVHTVSAGRAGSALAALVGLIGAVAGGLALARSTGRGRIHGCARRYGAVTALVAGPVALAVGAVVALTAEGGLGTGNGLGGAYVAMLFGLVSVGLGLRARSLGRTPGQRFN
ncbi:DUF6223 family protein [Streptomyces cavernicola]|uniref:DUF6223 family protein n=1 Tax=Streptomyces cavernicola TaxID=3043613 RepID=A0ABT6SB34_9ACTN|nr:DUF6223 family protein [Streptomyces sp. B-S-A6]MDI3405150.1 DUF6223 family protein [Streptomyces sp. B-S-A6]